MSLAPNRCMYFQIAGVGALFHEHSFPHGMDNGVKVYD